MLRGWRWAIAIAALAPGCGPATRDSRVPAGYPAGYAALQDAADREGLLIVWSALDRDRAARVVAPFVRLHPRIRLVYRELPAATLNARFIAASDAGRPTADFLWSSAMDLQIKLVNDGYTQAYVSPEASQLPPWANWKNEAWGLTSEPIALIYNRTLVADATMPRSHAELATFLDGRPVGSTPVATSDPRSSAVARLYLAQDEQADNGFWRLATAMGRAGVRQSPSAEDVLHDVLAGRAAIGYDVVGSYAEGEARRHARLGFVLPRDYTLLMSRIAVIPARAGHPSAARLFLDFLLSRQGQAALARANVQPVRADPARGSQGRPEAVPLRAIRVGPTLLVTQDRLTRVHFLREWDKATGRSDGAAPRDRGVAAERRVARKGGDR